MCICTIVHCTESKVHNSFKSNTASLVVKCRYLSKHYPVNFETIFYCIHPTISMNFKDKQNMLQALLKYKIRKGLFLEIGNYVTFVMTCYSYKYCMTQCVTVLYNYESSVQLFLLNLGFVFFRYDHFNIFMKKLNCVNKM